MAVEIATTSTTSETIFFPNYLDLAAHFYPTIYVV